MPRTFRNSLVRALLVGGWLWAGSLLGVAGLLDAGAIESVACWVIAVGAPLGFIATATTSLRVDRDGVTYRRLRETLQFPAAESTAQPSATGRVTIIVAFPTSNWCRASSRPRDRGGA